VGGARSFAVLAVALAAALLASGCSRPRETRVVEQRAENVRNPSDFPLFPGSRVGTVVPVDSKQMFAAIRASDPRAETPQNFRGHEVIAETSASMDQLVAWIERLRKSPPRGFRHVAEKGWDTRSKTASGAEAETGAQFDTPDGTRTVYVIAGDPRRLQQQMGPVFALMENYAAVPGIVRGPIDDQAKKQVGYSVTEMLDSKSPAGAVVTAIKRLAPADRRAILLIDESRER
jgi:hypothetical protein